MNIPVLTKGAPTGYSELQTVDMKVRVHSLHEKDNVGQKPVLNLVIVEQYGCTECFKELYSLLHDRELLFIARHACLLLITKLVTHELLADEQVVFWTACKRLQRAQVYLVVRLYCKLCSVKVYKVHAKPTCNL